MKLIWFLAYGFTVIGIGTTVFLIGTIGKIVSDERKARRHFAELNERYPVDV